MPQTTSQPQHAIATLGQSRAGAARDDQNASAQKLALALSTADVVILGWQLNEIADKLRDNKLSAIGGILPKRYVELERSRPFVASIKITPLKH